MSKSVRTFEEWAKLYSYGEHNVYVAVVLEDGRTSVHFVNRKAVQVLWNAAREGMVPANAEVERVNCGTAQCRQVHAKLDELLNVLGLPKMTAIANVKTDRIVDAIVRLKEAAKASKPQWVSVKERLPQLGEAVLVWGADQKILRDTRLCNGRWLCGAIGVTHWMPMPDPPSEEPCYPSLTPLDQFISEQRKFRHISEETEMLMRHAWERGGGKP